MKQLALITMATACLIAAAACNRDNAGNPTQRPGSPNGSTLGQSRETPPAGQSGQSVRPGDASPSTPAPRTGTPSAPPNQSPSPGQSSTGLSQGGVSSATTFDVADVDKNGVVDAIEAQAVPGLNFQSADTDKSESLSRQEFSVAMAGTRPPG
jgi:hypothetical protein